MIKGETDTCEVNTALTSSTVTDGCDFLYVVLHLLCSCMLGILSNVVILYECSWLTMQAKLLHFFNRNGKNELYWIFLWAFQCVILNDSRHMFLVDLIKLLNCLGRPIRTFLHSIGAKSEGKHSPLRNIYKQGSQSHYFESKMIRNLLRN